jgi:hypothetical protein
MSRENVRELLNRKNLTGVKSYCDNGFMILKKIDLSLLSEVLKEIIVQDTFEDSHNLKVDTFNGDNGQVQKGREMVHLTRLQLKKNKNKFQGLIQLLEQLKLDVLGRTKETGLNLSGGTSATCLFRSLFSELVEPQVMHCDDRYDDVNYESSAIGMIALEDDTLMRVVSGSHKFSSMEDLLDDTEEKDRFVRPILIRFNRGECLLMHPKLFHSGWMCERDNTRVQIYFGFERPNEVQILGSKISAHLNGENESQKMKKISLAKVTLIQKKKDKAKHLLNRAAKRPLDC